MRRGNTKPKSAGESRPEHQIAHLTLDGWAIINLQAEVQFMNQAFWNLLRLAKKPSQSRLISVHSSLALLAQSFIAAKKHKEQKFLALAATSEKQLVVTFLRQLATVYIKLQPAPQIPDVELLQRDFVINASHELRTPLTSMLGVADLLVSEIDSFAPELRRLVKILQVETLRLHTLCEDMLELSQLGYDQNQSQKRFFTFDLTPLIKDCLEQFADAKPEINFTLKLPKILVQGSKALLRRLFFNLINNVYQHCPSGTAVEIRASLQKEHYLIMISDDGPGIPTKDLPHIFQRFYRAHNSKHNGSGIGLNLAQQIAALHQGEITVQSSLYLGTKFTVSLPPARSLNR